MNTQRIKREEGVCSSVIDSSSCRWNEDGEICGKHFSVGKFVVVLFEIAIQSCSFIKILFIFGLQNMTRRRLGDVSQIFLLSLPLRLNLRIQSPCAAALSLGIRFRNTQ